MKQMRSRVASITHAKRTCIPFLSTPSNQPFFQLYILSTKVLQSHILSPSVIVTNHSNYIMWQHSLSSKNFIIPEASSLQRYCSIKTQCNMSTDSGAELHEGPYWLSTPKEYWPSPIPCLSPVFEKNCSIEGSPWRSHTATVGCGGNLCPPCLDLHVTCSSHLFIPISHTRTPRVRIQTMNCVHFQSYRNGEIFAILRQLDLFVTFQ